METSNKWWFIVNGERKELLTEEEIRDASDIKRKKLVKSRNVENYVFTGQGNLRTLIPPGDPFYGQILNREKFNERLNNVRKIIIDAKIERNIEPDGYFPNGSAFELKTYSERINLENRYSQIKKCCLGSRTKECVVIVLRPNNIECHTFKLIESKF